MALWNDQSFIPAETEIQLKQILQLKNLKIFVSNNSPLKKSLLKKLGDADDAMIQTGNGKE